MYLKACKNYITSKAKTPYNLKWREYLPRMDGQTVIDFAFLTSYTFDYDVTFFDSYSFDCDVPLFSGYIGDKFCKENRGKCRNKQGHLVQPISM